MSHSKKSPSTPLYYIRSSAQAKKRSLSQLISPNHSKSNCSLSISDIMSPMANSMQALAASHEELLMKYVLASAEIERLVISNATAKRETDQWKQKYKEYELLLKRKPSYESEIEESNLYKLKYEKERARVSLLEEDNTTLQETLNSKEEELRTLTEASFGAVGVDLIEKDKEIEFWKEKYEKLEDERIIQLKELRQKTEVVLSTKIEREVSEALKKYEQEKKQMGMKCEELAKEIQNLKGQLDFVNNEKVSMSTQLTKIKEKSSSDKEENKTLLAGHMKKFQEDIEEKKNRILELLNQAQENEKERLRLNDELERLREENSHVEQRMREGLKEKEEKIIEMIGQIQSLKEEVEILQIENSRLLREIEQVKSQNEYESMTQRSELTEENNKLGGQLEEVKQELEFSKKEIERLLEELNNAAKKDNNEEEIKELKATQLALTIHIDRQNQELEFLHKEREKFARQHEIDVRALKEMDKEKNHITAEYNTLQLRLDILQGDLNYANEEKEGIMKDLEVKEGVCGKLEEAYGMLAKDSVVLSAEIERLRTMIKEKSDRVEELEGYISSKMREMEGLQGLYDKETKEKDVEVNSFKTKLDAQKWHLVELQKEIVELNKELERSGKGRVKRDQMSQCGVGKIDERTTEDLLEEYSEQIRKYEKEFKSLVEDNERLREDREYKEKIEKEVIELRAMNVAHREEKIALKRENDALGVLAEEMSEYTQLLKDVRKERGELKERLEMLEREHEELKIENRVKEQEIEASRLSRVEVVERYETKINHLIERNSMLTMDNEEIKEKMKGQMKAVQQKEDTEKELDILKGRLMEMIKEARDVESAMRRIEEIMVRSERLEKEIREWKELYNSEQEKAGNQKREIERLVREYNEMLQKLGSAVEHKDKGHETVDILMREVKDDKATIKRLNEELWMLRNQSEHVRIEGNNRKDDLEKRLQEAEMCVERVKEAVGGVKNFEMVMMKIGEMKFETKRLTEWKQIYEERETKYQEEIKRSRNENESLRIKKLEMELETTRTSITVRDREMEEKRILHEETMRGMRENYKELESNYLILGETNKSLEGRIQTLMREVEILRNKEEDTHKANMNLISQLKEAEERIMQQISDIVKLNEKLADKQKEMDELEENLRGLHKGGEAYIQEKIERIEVELRKDVEKELIRCNEEYLMKKREVEGQLIDFKKRAEEDMKEKKLLIDKNEKLELQADDLAREVKVLKARQDDLIRASEIRLNVLKVEEQQGARAQKEKELQKIQQDFTERVNSYESEIKQLRFRISEFELQQVLYFIEVERLHGVNAEFMDELDKSQAEILKLSEETSQYKQVIEEFSREIGREKQQKIMLEDIIADLRTQIEGYEARLENFGRREYETMRSPPPRDQDVFLPLMKSPVVSNYITPVHTTRDSMVMEKRLAHSRFASIRKSRSELQEATEKFESEKNVMEMKLEQFKKIIQANKSELQSPQDVSFHQSAEKNQKENIMIFETVQEGSQQDQISSTDQYYSGPTHETDESYINLLGNKELNDNDRMRGSLRVPKNLMSQISLFNRKIANPENVRSGQGQGEQRERIDYNYFSNPIFEMTEEETRRSFK